MTTYCDRSFLSFGGGVQSTALALMLAYNPEVFENLGYSLPLHVIFADTGAEPDYVLSNVEKVFEKLKQHGLKTYTVASENILEDKRGLPPYFTKNTWGETGILPRQCTSEYKIKPLQELQRSILGFKKGQRIPSNTCNLWLGISVDEAQRAKQSRVAWVKNHYPLVDLRLDRTNCAVYAYKILGYQVQKSSCFFCPFKTQEEWVSMKRDRPLLFEQAIAFDEKIRHLPGVNNECFVHRSAIPLKDAVGQGIQMSLFNQEQEECSGGCFL